MIGVSGWSSEQHWSKVPLFRALVERRSCLLVKVGIWAAAVLSAVAFVVFGYLEVVWSSMNKAILMEVPEIITTERLKLRRPSPGDGPVLNALVRESFDQLQRWMPWAASLPSVEDTEIFVRQGVSDFLARRALPYFLCERVSDRLIGASGFHAIDWSVPKCEVGYWLTKPMQGRGYMSEALVALTDMALRSETEGGLSMVRVELRTDLSNLASQRVAERAGFQQEGVLRNESRDHFARVRSTVLFSRVSAEHDVEQDGEIVTI